MKDQLVKALALNGAVRIYADRTTDMVQEARDRFDLHPTACAALGRTLSIASIMGSMLKSDQEMLTITINGHGPIGSIIVDAYANGDVRGFVSDPHVKDAFRNGKLDVGAVVGTDGYLSVTKDLHMEENFKGTVELQTGEIAEDFTYYFAMSEQTPSAVAAGVMVNEDGSVKDAGALVIQMMPGATDQDIRIVEHVVEGLKPMTTLIAEYDDVNLDQLIRDMFEDAQILSTQDIHFSCPCSKERTKSVLMTMPRAEIEEIIDKQHGADITCNFCNERYHFDEEDLKDVLRMIDESKKEDKEEIPE